MHDQAYLKRKGFKLPAFQCLIFLALSFVVLAASIPTAATTGALAQPANGITRPAGGDVISGAVTVQGTAAHPNYLRYELAFLQESNPDAGWIVFAEGSQEVINGTLALWDTTVGLEVNAPIFPDGRYQLRLRVVKTDYNYDEYFVTNLTIANDRPTLTPTAEATVATAESQATVAPETTSSFQQPTAIASLTPFPTPTPPSTPVGAPAGVVAPGPSGENGGQRGILATLAAIETGHLVRAFWGGVALSGVLFFAMGLYLLFRAIVRRLWRRMWARLVRDRISG